MDRFDLCLSPGATETAFFARSGEGAAAGATKARPGDVVRCGLDAFDAGRASVVHGAGNGFLTFAARIFSRAFTAKVLARMTKPKEASHWRQRCRRSGGKMLSINGKQAPGLG